MLTYLLVFLLGAYMALQHVKQNQPNDLAAKQHSGGGSSWTNWAFWGATSQHKRTRVLRE